MQEKKDYSGMIIPPYLDKYPMFRWDTAAASPWLLLFSGTCDDWGGLRYPACGFAM